MMSTARSPRRWFPTFAGLIVGMVFSLSAGVAASSPWANLYLISVMPDSIVGGTVWLGAAADGPGISSVQFQVSGVNVGPEITQGDCWTAWDSTSVADGTYTVGIVARDSMGNSILTTPVAVTVHNTARSTVDTAAPSVMVSTPSAGATVSGWVSVTAAAADDVGIASVWFTIDGTTIGGEDTIAPYQLTWLSSSLSNGTHAIRAFARDGANNVTTSAAINVTVNNQGTFGGSVGSSGCSTPDPFVTIGGGICVGGGWIPPGMVVQGPTTDTSWSPPTGATAPAPSGTTTTTSTSPVAPGACATSDPFTSIGGGICIDGGWRPIWSGWVLVPSPSLSGSSSTSSSGEAVCTIADPFVIFGGGVCIPGGGWIPKGLVLR